MQTADNLAQHPSILACADRSDIAQTVTDYAAWAAVQLQGSLTLLNVIDRHPERSDGHDHSGAIGINAQQTLLETLSEEDEARSRSLREQGRVFLHRLRERALAAGVREVDTRQRHGELQQTLTSMQDDVRLFVLGRRGASAQATQRDLGRNFERVVRALKRPVLAVGDKFHPPRRVMIAFDGGTVTRRGIQMLAACSLFGGLPIHLLMSGVPRADGEQQLAWARQQLVDAGHVVTSALIPGDAERVIAEQSQAEGIDLLVMGAYSHAPWRKLLFGSRTTELLRAVRLPTLLLR